MIKNYLIYAILTVITLVFVLIGIMAISDHIPGLTGGSDTQYPSLLISGRPMAQFSQLKIVSLLFGVCIITIFLLCVTLGAQKANSRIQNNINKTILIGAILYLGVFLWMVTCWWSYTETYSYDYFLGLPKPTAILMFGLLFTPLIFSFFYITQFDEWVYSQEDEERFKEIIRTRQSKNTTL